MKQATFQPTSALRAPQRLTRQQLREYRRIAIGQVGSAFRDEAELARFKRELNKVVS